MGENCKAFRGRIARNRTMRSVIINTDHQTFGWSSLSLYGVNRNSSSGRSMAYSGKCKVKGKDKMIYPKELARVWMPKITIL